MKLGLLKSLWGVVTKDGGRRELREVLPFLKDQGYIGVECSVKLAHDLDKFGEFSGLMEDHGLAWVPILFTSGPLDSWSPFIGTHKGCSHTASVAGHLDALRGQVEDMQRLGSHLQLPFINVHAGHDSFEQSKATELLHAVADLEAQLHTPIVHEVHRGRVCHSPWVTQRLALSVPSLKIVADYSHFTAACEVQPWDGGMREVVRALLPHVHHVHARLGFDNGPQVSDPRVEMWQRHVAAFEEMWSEIFSYQRASGRELMTATPEYGPPSYQPCSRDGEPLADIDAVNEWTAKRLHALCYGT